MPWKETSTMDQHILFIAEYLSGDYTKSALCRHYDISRRTGDKWIERYRMHGPEGLYERSRRPHGHPHTTAAEIAERIVENEAGAPKLWTQEGDGSTPCPGTGPGLAGRQHGRRNPEAKGSGAAKTPAPPRPPGSRGPWSTAALRHRAGVPTSRATCDWVTGSAATR